MELCSIPGEIPKEKIGLPTGGAVVDTVETAEHRFGRYVRVQGRIRPVDPSAPDIRFQVNLPEKWNRKAFRFGGSGSDGILITGEAPAIWQNPGDPTPLERGYATFGSDGGHMRLEDEWDASWAANEEACRNYAWEQLKKSRDTAMEIIKAYYGTEPDKVYMCGRSNGGRETLQMLQRYPEEYDGAVVLYPVYNMVPKMLKDSRNADVLCADGGAAWISPEDYQKVRQVILEECDGLDGVEDGLICNWEGAACKESVILKRLRGFLTEAQVQGILQLESDLEIGYPLRGGNDRVPGYNVLSGAPMIDPYLSQYGPEPGARKGHMAKAADGSVRYQIIKDETVDPAGLDLEKYREQIQEASQWSDASETDYGPFIQKGGKLILLHGAADQIVSIKSTVEYYRKLKERYGEALTDWLRFFVVPGFGHGVGDGFLLDADLLTVLEQWTEEGRAPETILARDQNPNTPERTLPLYPYPWYPRYQGHGDVYLAESYGPALPEEV